jgi:hypothetical protein
MAMPYLSSYVEDRTEFGFAPQTVQNPLLVEPQVPERDASEAD